MLIQFRVKYKKKLQYEICYSFERQQVSIAYLRERIELWNISTECTLLRYASIPKVWSEKENIGSGKA